MCGICGIYNFGKREKVSQPVIERMTRSISHRGPDDEGMHFDHELALGFRRLSIIDLAGGHQPMSNEDESIWVVFNGEIYNYPELKQELTEKGHNFRTSSDTEVLVHGYREWGKDLLPRLNGMFGFAIWDAREKRLIVARDRAGIKFIYYHLDGERLVWGSELRPVLLSGHAPVELDIDAVSMFLRYRYTPSPHTVFKGVKKLRPGWCLIVEDGKVSEECYWDARPKTRSDTPSVADARAELLDVYDKAIKRQLMSDVPLGLLLSGGLDSGLMLGLMNHHGKDWPTFTVGFGESFKDDELSDAAETAKILKCPNTSVQIDRNMFEASLTRIINVLEEPVASPSVVPMYYVCERARQDVKVALMGQGPDELFGGYKRHLGVRYGAMWRGLPGPLRGLMRAALANSKKESIQRGLHSLDVEDRWERYRDVFSIVPEATMRDLFRAGSAPNGKSDPLISCWDNLRPAVEGLDELGGFQFVEIRSSLPDELLMYADKISMYHGLEVRVPFLDHEVIEHVEQLPSSLKVRRGQRKFLHRELCRSYLPREILARKKKGFAVNVVDDWYRDSIEGRLKDTLLNPESNMYEHLDPAAVRNLVEEHRSGARDNHKIIYSLIVFELWMREYFNPMREQVAALRAGAPAQA